MVTDATHTAPGAPPHLAEAVSAFSQGDYANALPIFLRHAERGDADAQAWVGASYAGGGGVPASLPTAFDWYLRAAEQGHPFASTNVGAMLAMGHGVRQDAVAGAAWLGKAADAGDPMAQYNLATLYAKGDGVAQDKATAAGLYRRAAEAGHYPSQARLGYLHANGIGVEKNRVAAFMWLSLAARHGVGTALNALEEVVGQMSAEEKGQGTALLQRWRPSRTDALPLALP